MNHSPFPGMDPYLEKPSRWKSIHHRLIVAISDQLTDRLSPAYWVEIEERVYIVTPEEQSLESIAPDVFIVEKPRQPTPVTTTLTITPPVLVEPLINIEITEPYINIVSSDDQTVLTTIEVLSPANKQPQTKGRSEFIKKRAGVMKAHVHWIEIDLLRAGERFPEVTKRSDYYALLKRTGGRAFEVWPIDLRDHLPVIAVPLRSPDPDAALDLQAALEDVYWRGRYFDKLNYTKPPPAPRLDKEDAAWVQTTIKTWLTQRSHNHEQNGYRKKP